MRNKINIHNIEELGFFITMWIVSIVIGMGIVSATIKLIDLIKE
jgi:hypothetical protein